MVGKLQKPRAFGADKALANGMRAIWTDVSEQPRRIGFNSQPTVSFADTTKRSSLLWRSGPGVEDLHLIRPLFAGHSRSIWRPFQIRGKHM